MATDLQPKKVKTEFPQDILFFHILPRLPGNYVLRFKCVSKQWNSFLSTPLFANMHLQYIPNEDYHTPHKLLILSNARPFKFQTMDCEAPEDGLTKSRNLPFKVTDGAQHVYALTSFHGLVCVGQLDRYACLSSELILWNPLTGDHKVLSRNDCGNRRCYESRNIFRLFYSSSDDDYKLICVHSKQGCGLYIYSLKSDSWRKVNSTSQLNQRFDYYLYEGISSWLNGSFYFLWTVRKDLPIADLPFYSIIRFNTKTEKFTEIPTRIARHPDRSTYLLSTVFGGNIHIVYVIRERYRRRSRSRMEIKEKVELWRMDADETWTKVETYFAKKTRYPYLIHVMKNENWLMVGEDYYYKVDWEKHTKDKLCSFSKGRIEIRGGKYFETFVSPNRYIK